MKQSAKPLQITSLKSLTQMSNEDNDLRKTDQKLNDILEKLKAEVNEKRSAVQKANNDWLNLLKMDNL